MKDQKNIKKINDKKKHYIYDLLNFEPAIIDEQYLVNLNINEDIYIDTLNRTSRPIIK
jgi:hypothetical protein